MALYNPTDTAVTICLDFDDVELGCVTEIKDLFTLKYEKTDSSGRLCRTIPPHGVKIYRLKANERLPREDYEAETAYLSSYQELYNAKAVGTPFYEKDSSCSGGIKVTNLGYRPDNDLQWRDIYRNESGKYSATVYCVNFDEGDTLYLSVNNGKGEVYTIKDVEDGKIRLTLDLDSGKNVVRLYNDHSAMPEIDKLTIEPLSIDSLSID